MEKIEKSTYGKEGFQLGNNIAESATLTASDAVEAGTVLIRSSGKNWVPATASTLVAGAGIGITIAPVASGSNVPCDVSIGGRFNRKFVKVEGVEVTDAQCDILRGQGIFALTLNPID